jgi:hypothetical protein
MAPVGPVAPVAPGAPDVPGRLAPDGPVAPVEPTVDDPVGPVAPVAPPIRSIGPVAPVAPTVDDPAGPVAPVGPDAPVDPTGDCPLGPVAPVAPTPPPPEIGWDPPIVTAKGETISPMIRRRTYRMVSGDSSGENSIDVPGKEGWAEKEPMGLNLRPSRLPSTTTLPSTIPHPMKFRLIW